MYIRYIVAHIAIVAHTFAKRKQHNYFANATLRDSVLRAHCIWERECARRAHDACVCAAAAAAATRHMYRWFWALPNVARFIKARPYGTHIIPRCVAKAQRTATVPNSSQSHTSDSGFAHIYDARARALCPNLETTASALNICG